ncbi:MAG: STAS/SEC14 domain-containing protein [Pseudomonadota bacterium]
MLKVVKTAPNHLDLFLEGQIDGPEMNAALSELVDTTNGMENATMFYHISGFAMPTPSAFMVELGYFPKLFGLISKFRRCAVVTEHAWLRAAAELEGVVIPGLDIKSFEPGQEDMARRWLSSEDHSDNVPV